MLLTRWRELGDVHLHPRTETQTPEGFENESINMNDMPDYCVTIVGGEVRASVAMNISVKEFEVRDEGIDVGV